MKSVAVIYETKYGHTKKYADWIREELNGDIFENMMLKADSLLNYDVLIFGSHVIAGKLPGLDTLKKNFEKFAGKERIVFTCGIANPKIPENRFALAQNLEKNLTKEMAKNVKAYNFRGGMYVPQMGVVHKAMMKMMVKMLKKKDPNFLREDDKIIIEAMKTPQEFIERESIKPLVKYVRALK